MDDHVLGIFLICIILLTFPINTTSECNTTQCTQYYKSRDQLVQRDQQTHFDKDVILSSDELRVDQLMSMIRDEEILTDDGRFVFSKNFRVIKDTIENSRLYSLIKGMPKGGVLHTHGIGSSLFAYMNGSYDPECWVNLGIDTISHPKYSFMYSKFEPNNANGTLWKNMVLLRNESSDKNAFDQQMYNNLLFNTPPDNINQTGMWIKFDQSIHRVMSLLSKESVWKAHIFDSFQRFVDDGITHFEVRGFMSAIRDENGNPKYNDTVYLNLWISCLNEFNKNIPPHKQLTGLFIYSVARSISIESMYAALLNAVNLQRGPYGEYLVGFDIVDEEDRFNTIRYYLQDWLDIKDYLEMKGWPQIKYYFHTGETDWDKYRSANLYDALLLNATRIGHGFALRDYPYLMSETISNGIAIEVCPISNQMLRLLDDLRDHPAVSFLNSGVLVTISNDDPMVYGNDGLTYDYWGAYMSWNITLAGLKQLVINGIQYSALSDSIKEQKLSDLMFLWDSWIKQTVTS